jgi:uncharacterized protein (DUF2267 family)
VSPRIVTCDSLSDVYAVALSVRAFVDVIADRLDAEHAADVAACLEAVGRRVIAGKEWP